MPTARMLPEIVSTQIMMLISSGLTPVEAKESLNCPVKSEDRI
jgi:hypothetical protein